MQADSSANTSPIGNVCRLCRRGDVAMNLHKLCKCRYLVHKSCLEASLRDTGMQTCLLCGETYNLLWTPRYGVAGGLWLWFRTRADNTQMLLVLLYVVLLTPKAVLSAVQFWSKMRDVKEAAALRESGEYWLDVVGETQQATWLLVLTAMMLAGYMGLLLAAVAVNIAAFRRWYRTTFRLDVLDTPSVAA